MVQIEVKFKDGSKIYYVTSPNGDVRRVVDYAANDDMPAEHVDNAGKYYYLRTLVGFKDIGGLVYSDIEYIYNVSTEKYVHQTNVEICRKARQHQYFLGSDVFYTIIYLAMIDMENSKLYDCWLGKKLVLDSCRAVLLENIPYKKAANLLLRNSDYSD